MSKRNAKDGKNNFYSPAKKQKLNITIENGLKANNRQSSKKNQEIDIWGDDFQEEDLQNIDLVTSQAYSQVTNVSFDESINTVVKPVVKDTTKPANSWSMPSFNVKNHVPSQKKSPTVIYPKPSTSNVCNQIFLNTASPKNKKPGKCFPENKSLFKSKVIQSSKLEDCSKSTIPSDENIPLTQSTEVVFENFERKLMNRDNMNSTFLSQNSVVVVLDDSQLNQISKLKEQNKKLSDNLLTKEGEVTYLRQELQRQRQKLANETLEKSKIIQEKENNHKAQLIAMQKEKDNITTELNFQNLQISSLMEKTKILEKGSVKLVEPHSANFNSGTRHTTINRESPSVKIKHKECATQTKIIDKSIYKLKDSAVLYPLKQIPESIFESSESEKPIVDIYVIEKIGKSNLPILQEADNLRIFGNTELVKPIVSFVDKKQLCVQFFLSNLSKMLNKTMEEINSAESVPIINMVIATTRELLLNTLTSLKKILDAMKNDDLRDMNDFYLSNYSTIVISHVDNICCAKRFYEKERGVELRRSLAVISYVVLSSTYLGEYVTGKRRLKVEEDYSYEHYIQQLKTYNSWSNKECDFEFLEMILQFVTVIGLTRRAHQFCGVINAIALALNNAQKSVGFCSTGLDYVYKIFREIVFSRPLLECIPAISEMLMTFANSTQFSEKLCLSPKSSAVISSTGNCYFRLGPDTCPIEIFIFQIMKLLKNPIIMINTSYAVISFMKTIIPMNVFPWRDEQENSCQCSLSLINFAMKSLYKCTNINIDNLEANFQNLKNSNNSSKIPDRNFWYQLRRKQKDTVIRGIQFLYHFLNRESDYILRKSEVAYTFFLVLHHVKNIPDLRLPENDSDIIEKLENMYARHTEELDGNFQSSIDMNKETKKFDKFNKEFKWKSVHRSRRQVIYGNFTNSSSS